MVGQARKKSGSGRRRNAAITKVRGIGKEEKVKWIKINLVDIYSLGHLDVSASTILKTILELYNTKYELLMNESPDVGTEYHVDDKEFIDAIEEAYMRHPIDAVNEVIMNYAQKKNATAVVELFDGYEHAFALLYEKE
jgi:hypothetical protein